MLSHPVRLCRGAPLEMGSRVSVRVETALPRLADQPIRPLLLAHTATHYAVYFWQPNRSLYQDDPIEQLAVWDISSPSPYRPSEDPTGDPRPRTESPPPGPIGLWRGMNGGPVEGRSSGERYTCQDKLALEETKRGRLPRQRNSWTASHPTAGLARAGLLRTPAACNPAAAQPRSGRTESVLHRGGASLGRRPAQLLESAPSTPGSVSGHSRDPCVPGHNDVRISATPGRPLAQSEGRGVLMLRRY